MDVPFELRCLGEPALLGPDGQPVRLRVRKHIALLVYLVVESQARHRREHLAELLWPNLPEAEGRHSLATGLTALRTAFGAEVLDAGREGVRWAYGALGVDLDRLASGDVLGDESGKGLLQVAPFLEGFEIPGATEFQLWRERQRASWLPRVRDALVVLMDRCRRTGDSRQIERMADRMLALDDLSEEAVRAKMEARAFAGDRLSALRIFEAWKERLHEELGAAPSPLLDGMAIRLRKRGWERTTHPGIAAVRTEQWKDRPFIGRGPEYRVLYEGWERTQRNEPGHVLVVGESGIGKSTLVERLTTAAGLEGASVSRVQCFELEREIPFAAIGALVHGLLERPGATATSPEALGELSRAVPEVRRRYVSIPVPQPTEGETARFRIAEALHELVTCVADEHPLILVVDDHHFADDASLALLHILFRRVEGQRVMLVLVARQSEMGGSPHAVRLRDNLDRFGTRSAELPPLTEAESDELVTALVPPDGPQPNPAVRRALIRAGRGYPMVMELLCRDWLEHGERSLALSLDAMTADPSPSGAPIEAIRQLHGRINSALDPTTRNVLNLCAVLGHRLNDPSMYSLVDVSMGQSLSSFTRLCDMRVLRDSTSGIEFVNELVRAHTYLSIPSPLRKALHANIADRLKRALEEGEDILGLEIAWHSFRAGRASEGHNYLLSGARQGLDRGAALVVDRALSSADPPDSSAKASMQQLLLAEAKQQAGAGIEALALLDRLPDQLESPQSEWVAVLRAEIEYEQGQNSYLALPGTLDRLERIASDGLSARSRGKAFCVLASIAYRARDAARALRLIQRHHLLHDIEEPVAAVEARFALAMLYSLTGDRFQCESVAHSAMQIAEDARLSNATVALLRNGLGAILVARGEYDAAVRHFTSAFELGKHLDNTTMMLRAAANLALCYHRLGDWANVIAWGERAISQRGVGFGGHAELMNSYHTAMAFVTVGRGPEARRLMQRTWARISADAPAWYAQAHLLQTADVLWALGDRSRAVAAARQAIKDRNYAVQSVSYAGAFARWAVHTARTDIELARTKSALRELGDQFDKLDLLDQAELLIAEEHLRRGRRKNGDWRTRKRSDSITSRLALLPPAASEQLKRWETSIP